LKCAIGKCGKTFPTKDGMARHIALHFTPPLKDSPKEPKIKGTNRGFRGIFRPVGKEAEDLLKIVNGGGGFLVVQGALETRWQKCQYCQTNVKNMEKHLAMCLTPGKQFGCGKCIVRFATFSALTKHLKETH